MLRSLARAYSTRSRRRRAALLRRSLELAEGQRVLDLGGGDGRHAAEFLALRRNVTIADLDADALATARARYGFETIRIDGTERLDIPDRAFDIVFCSSVIEHVTGPKEQVLDCRDGRAFRAAAWRHQKTFADEIRRIADAYFVQTPNKYFLIESHTWLPVLVVLLPRPLQVRVIDLFARFWPKRTRPDWNLLTAEDMQRLFPDAEILLERSLGMTKSIMAVRAAAPERA